jgi:hypothetical protein
VGAGQQFRSRRDQLAAILAGTRRLSISRCRCGREFV